MVMATPGDETFGVRIPLDLRMAFTRWAARMGYTMRDDTLVWDPTAGEVDTNGPVSRPADIRPTTGGSPRADGIP